VIWVGTLGAERIGKPREELHVLRTKTAGVVLSWALIAACTSEDRQIEITDPDASAGTGGSGGTAGGSAGAAASGGGGTSSDGSAGGGGTAGGAVSCSGVPSSAELGSQYLLVLSTNLDPTKPFVSLVDVTIQEASPQDRWIQWTLQPLAAVDRATPVGPVIAFGSSALGEDWSFLIESDQIVLPAEANPVTHYPVTASLSFDGKLCENFGCGNVGGTVTSPINGSLTGSTFAMVPQSLYADPPPINCDGDEAEPLAGGGSAGATGGDGISSACKACAGGSCTSVYTACSQNQKCSSCVNIDWDASGCANNAEYMAICACAAAGPCWNDCAPYC
jgi:hypothetical protein